MTRNAARVRILKVTHETGPRKRTVLLGLAAGHASLVDNMITDGSLVKYGSKRGTTYGTPSREGNRRRG